jgi:8-oxo-dGTP pyrophosphatase MutT (NUDIX family)
MEPQAAVAILECAGAVLLIRRAQRPGDPWSGQWGLPGGRREAADADLLATARREVHEEVGVVLDASAWTAQAVQLAGLHRGPGVPVAPFHRQLPQRPHLSLAATEVAGCHWLPLMDFHDPSQHLLGTVPGGGTTAWPHLPLLDMPLWGFTYRVLQACYGNGLS